MRQFQADFQDLTASNTMDSFITSLKPNGLVHLKFSWRTIGAKPQVRKLWINGLKFQKFPLILKSSSEDSSGTKPRQIPSGTKPRQNPKLYKTMSQAQVVQNHAN